jgi:hypothetical protein
MLRRSPLTRKTPMRRARREGPSVSEPIHPTALKPLDRPVVYAKCGDGAVGVPKSKPKRNPALLAMANGRECLLCPVGQCQCTPGSAVACHSNLSIHGKAGARKADDQYSVWGGDAAHRWLDQSGASANSKVVFFMTGHLRQVLAWRRIAADPSEPARFRKAALWALEQLGALPVGETA